MVHFLLNSALSLNKNYFYFVQSLQALVWHSPRFCFELCCIHCTLPHSTVIGKHKNIKFHFYADDTQFDVHLSLKNASSDFEQLDKRFNNVKE